MFSRTSIIALAAVAGLSATALTPTSAAARGGGGGGFGHAGGFSHSFAMSRSVGHGPVVHRAVAHLPIKTGLHKMPIKSSLKSGLKPGPKFAKHWPHKHGCYHHHCYYPWWYVGPNYVVDVEPETAVVESIAAPLAAPVQRTDNCNCLTKQYLPDGAVLFTDASEKQIVFLLPSLSMNLWAQKLAQVSLG